MNNATALVTFAGVQKTYDGKTLVVGQLDLDGRRGEFLTLLGPSCSSHATTQILRSTVDSRDAR